MFRSFCGRTADEAWQSVADAFRQTEETTDVAAPQASRAGATREILHATISVAEPRQRWVMSRKPALNPAFAIAEVIWILSGRNDAALVNYFNSQLPKYAGAGPTYHGAYGHRLRYRLGIDQLDRAYRALLKKPESRQVVLQIWDARCDLPGEDGEPVAEDIPCNVLSMLKVRAGALEWTQILRSNDVFLGLPHNLVQFTTLQEIVAGWLGVAVGSYNQLSDSLHVYDRHADMIVASSPTALMHNVDSLALPKHHFDQVLNELVTQTEAVTRDDVSAAQLLRTATSSSLPPGYKHLLCVLCAEGARRRRCLGAAAEIMAACGNPCLAELFDRWTSRWPNSTSDGGVGGPQP